jgi:hypothetical protein
MDFKEKVSPITIKFFLFDKNICQIDKFEFFKEDHVRLSLLEKDSHWVKGIPFEDNFLEEFTVEFWQTPEYRWDEQHWSQWIKIYEHTFKDSEVVDRKEVWVNDKGKTLELTFEFASAGVETRYGEDGKLNKEWVGKSRCVIQKPVKYDIRSGKPIQTFICSHDIHDHYEKPTVEQAIKILSPKAAAMSTKKRMDVGKIAKNKKKPKV